MRLARFQVQGRQLLLVLDVSRFEVRWILLACAAPAWLALWLFLALDGRHHPDEPLYLYLAAYAEVAAILDPAHTPAYTFYVSRILHLLLARAVFALLGPGEATVQMLAALYALFVLGAITLALASVRRLVRWHAEMALAGAIVAVSPIVLWLVGKTLPESPALFATSLAVYAFLRSLDAADGRAALPWSLVASLALVVVALTRNALILAPLTLGITLLLFGGWRVPRQRVLVRGLAIGILACLLFLAALALLGIEAATYFWVYRIAGSEYSPILVRLYVGIVGGGPLLVALGLAFLHRPRREAMVLLVWFALATASVYVLLADLEARYLLVNFVPLAGLGCLATGALLTRLRAGLVRTLVVSVVLAVLALGGRLVQPFMEHEVKSDQIRTVISMLDQHYGGPGAYTLLTAWHHSDYHYLRVAYPDHRIYSVERSQYRRSVSELDEKDRRFYGDAIALDFESLLRIPRPWLYFGFEANPAIANFRWLADRLPYPELRHWAHRIIDRMAKRRHFFDTWVWREPRIQVVPVVAYGHYRIAELVPMWAVGIEGAVAGALDAQDRRDPEFP